MSAPLTCPHGHPVTLSEAATLAPAGGLACPVCGAAVRLTDPAANGSESPTLPPVSPEAPTLAPTSAPAPAERVAVPGYEVLSELGRGGMGVVYKARHVGLNRLVALKMILAGGHAGPDELARFRGEAEAVARLKHPNVVQVYDVGEAGGLPYFSLEFVEGGGLDRKLAGTPLPPAEAAALVETLARAMAAAHAAGLVHRDLKPANILLTPDGTPKVTDFGLAKKLDTAGQTASGAVMGTPSYMAPEQAGGKSKEIGPACDVYALGAILYECLTGRPPFKAATALDTILQVVSDEPVPPRLLSRSVDPDLETVCLKCLAKDPRDRYASAATLAEDLRRFLEGDRPIHARPLGEWASILLWARKRPIIAVLTALVVIGTLLLQLFYTALSFKTSMLVNAFSAGLAGFLTTMAILVRPRRWVVFGAALFLLVTLGLPCLVLEYLPAGSEDVVKGVPDILFVPLGLGVGAVLAGLFGGMSRRIARRHQHDMLTVFFGGVLGVMCLTPLCCCVTAIDQVVFREALVDSHPGGLFFGLHFARFPPT